MSKWRPVSELVSKIEEQRVAETGMSCLFGIPEPRELTEEQRREAEGWQQRHDDANYRRKLRKREIDAERKGVTQP